MQLIVSLPDDDIDGAAALSDDYSAAWDGWADSGDARDWLAVTGDGLDT